MKQQQLVGAYRFGETDEILNTRGIRGLYTNTLFKYQLWILPSPFVGPQRAYATSRKKWPIASPSCW